MNDNSRSWAGTRDFGGEAIKREVCSKRGIRREEVRRGKDGPV